MNVRTCQNSRTPCICPHATLNSIRPVFGIKRGLHSAGPGFTCTFSLPTSVPSQHKLSSRRSSSVPVPRGHRGRCCRLQASQSESRGPVSADSEGELPSWSGDYSPGDVLGKKYTIVETIGRGSNGVTYKARTNEGKEVAIKALSLKSMTGWKQLELFEREAKVLESLTHPGIPQYLDYFEEDSQKDRGFFLVQELAQGKSLAQLVSGGWRADEAEARRIAVEILGILEYLSSRRPAVVHRDVKPDNIVLEGGKAGGRVFLVDFGGVQAAAASDSFGMGSTVIGTYGFMAPEQFRGAAMPASDLYSLGGTLLYLLTGRSPNEFPQDRMQINFKDVVEVSPSMSAVLEGLLEPLLEDRTTAKDALALLSGKATDQTQLSRTGDTPPGARARVRERRGKIRIDIPAASLMSSERMGLAGFAATWNIGIGVWTASTIAAGSILGAAFSIPFWAAGFSVAREALKGGLGGERLDFNGRTWSISRNSRFSKRSDRIVAKGKTSDLKGAEVVFTGAVNDVPTTEVLLKEGFKEHRFGAGLSSDEQRWVAAKITSFLQSLPGQPASEAPPRRRHLSLGQQITQDVNRRVEGDLRARGINVQIGSRDDSWMMPGATPGLGQPRDPMFPADGSYEADILWDEDEARAPGEEYSSDSDSDESWKQGSKAGTRSSWSGADDSGGSASTNIFDQGIADIGSGISRIGGGIDEIGGGISDFGSDSSRSGRGSDSGSSDGRGSSDRSDRR